VAWDTLSGAIYNILMDELKNDDNDNYNEHILMITDALLHPCCGRTEYQKFRFDM
jgi:hypothetical protein